MALSRSHTRITNLEYCQKKYFFQYYGQELKQINQELREQNNTLKGLKSIKMWTGEKTHQFLSNYLHAIKNGQTIDNQKFQAEIKEVMDKEFEESKNRDYKIPTRTFGLSEHFYGENIDDQLEIAQQQVRQNIEAITKSQRYEKLLHYFKTARTVYIEKPGTPDYESMKVQTHLIPQWQNISIMAAPDFGVIFSDNKYLILDWKSGKEEIEETGISDQLKIYGLKLLLKKNTKELNDLEIKAYEIYLPSMNEKGGILSQDDINGIIQKVADDVEFQKQFLVDQDIERNQPLKHTAFKRTTSEKKCANCTFREVCQKLLNYE